MAELQLGNIKPAGNDLVVVDSKYVKGGYVVVADADERDNLNGTSHEGLNIVDGSLCYCVKEATFYQYDGSEKRWYVAVVNKATEAAEAAEADHADKADKATKADQLKIGTKYYTVNVSSTDVLVFEEV